MDGLRTANRSEFLKGDGWTHGRPNRTNFLKRTAEIYGPLIWSEFIKGMDEGPRPNQSVFSKGHARIHGPPIWSDFLKTYTGIHGRSNQVNFVKRDTKIHGRANRSKFIKGNAGIHGPPIWSDFLKRMQGPTHGRIRSIYERGCKDPRMGESVQLSKRGYKNQRTVDLVRCF